MGASLRSCHSFHGPVLPENTAPAGANGRSCVIGIMDSVAGSVLRHAWLRLVPGGPAAGQHPGVKLCFGFGLLPDGFGYQLL